MKYMEDDMYYTKMLIPTIRETPQEAEAISHKFMLKAGLVRRLASGIYIFLPLGYKALRNIENINMGKAETFIVLEGSLIIILIKIKPIIKKNNCSKKSL